MKRKKEIEEIKEKNENLRNSIEKLKRINVDNMKEVRNWYSKMNMHMIKRKNMHLWIKESMDTEHLLELIIKRNEDIIINNNKLNELNNWKTFKKEEQIENKKRKKESIKKMKKQIEKLDKQIECAQFNIDSLQIKTKNANYIINPFSDIMEKYNEIYIQREMMFKFKDFYMKKKNENALLLRDINKVKKEYPDKDIISTGHSLGGSLAEIVGALNGELAVGFNAYGVRDLFNENAVIQEDNIVNYVNTRDAVTMVNGENHIGEIYSVPNIGNNFFGKHNAEGMGGLFEREKITTEEIKDIADKKFKKAQEVKDKLTEPFEKMEKLRNRIKQEIEEEELRRQIELRKFRHSKL